MCVGLRHLPPICYLGINDLWFGYIQVVVFDKGNSLHKSGLYKHIKYAYMPAGGKG